MPDKKGNINNALLIQMIISFFWETFVAMAFGYFVGRWLDERFFSGENILIYVLTIAGIFAGIRNLIKRALQMSGGDDVESGKKSD